MILIILDDQPVELGYMIVDLQILFQKASAEKEGSLFGSFRAIARHLLEEVPLGQALSLEGLSGIDTELQYLCPGGQLSEAGQKALKSLALMTIGEGGSFGGMVNLMMKK